MEQVLVACAMLDLSYLGREDALCSAVRDGKLEEVARMLSDPEQYDPNSDSDYDLRYMTALERAVDELHFGIAALLFVHGADPAENVYKGEPTGYCGYNPEDVRLGFEEALKENKPIAGFPGLHALLYTSGGERGCKRMRSILFLMELSMAHKWDSEMSRHLRIGFGANAVVGIHARLKCVLLCLKRALPIGLPQCFISELTNFVMLEEVNSAFRVLAQTGSSIDDELSDEDGEDCVHANIGSQFGPESSVTGGAGSSHEEVVVQHVQHDEVAVVIHPDEAAKVTAEIEAGFVGRLAASCGEGLGEHPLAIPQDLQDSGVFDPEIVTSFPFSRLVLLNFTRHPRSFEAGLMADEGLREVREALNRSGLDLRLKSGAFVFVSPDEYPVVMLAVKGKTLTASHVIVPERLEPVVRAAVDLATSHRDNVRVRGVQDLGFAGEDPVIVERTFLSIPRALRSPASVANSTTAAHDGTNPRRLRLMSDA